MARPFAWIGFAFFASLFTAALYGKAAAAALALTGVITLVLSFVLFAFRKSEEKRRLIAVFGAVILIAVGWISFYTRLLYTPALKLVDKQVTVQAEITDFPVFQYNRWYYSLKTKSINGQECDFPIRLSSPKSLEVEPFDTVTADMYIYELGAGQKETKIKYKAKGLVLGAYAVNSACVKISKTEDKPFKANVVYFRQWIKTQLRTLLPGREGALLKGMLLGDKSDLTEKEESWFRTTGTSHLMAVSGLHISIWVSALMWFLDRVKTPGKIKPLVCMAFVIFFMALTGFTASVTRAGLMMMIVLFGRLLWEQADSLNSLGIAAVVILLQNPYAVLDLGFLLSFSATAGILICSPVLQKRIERKLDFLKGKKLEAPVLFCLNIVVVTVSAILFTLPVQVFFIGEFSLIAPVSNLLMTNAGGAAMVLVGLASLFSGVGIFSFLKYPLAFAAGILAKYLLWIAGKLSEIPYAQVRADLIYVKLWVVVTIILILFSVFVMNRNKTFLKMTAFASIIFLLVGTLSYGFVHNGETEIDVLDVGNGSAILVINGEKVALVGCGGDYNAESKISYALRKRQIKELSLLFVPRNEKTENSAASDVLVRWPVNFLVSSYDDEEFNVVPKEKRIVSQSGKITLWDDTTLQFIDYGTQSAALLTIDKTKVLFCFCPAVKIAELPPEWYMADALVCRQAVPRDAPDYTLTVVTGDSKISLYKNELNKRGALLATAGDGSVEILTKGNHSVSAGRNNNGARWRKGIKTTNKIKELF